MSRFPRCRPAAAAGVLATLLLSLAVTSCGVTDDEKTDGSTTTTSTEPETTRAPVEAWTADICEALTVWSDAFDQMGEDFGGELDALEAGDVAKVRDLLTDFFGQAADQTHQLGDRLEEVGAPDIGHGDDIATDIRKGVSKVQGELTHLKNQVSDLPIDDPAEFGDEIDRLNDEFEAAIDEISAALDNFEDKYGEDGARLDEVLESDDTCADVGT